MEDDTHFTEETLKAQDGKSVPVTAYTGGPVVGKATMKYNPMTKTLDAELHINDPELAEQLTAKFPPIIFRQGE